VTFPLGRAASHSSLPHRPDHTTKREPPKYTPHSPAKVYYEWAGRFPEIVWQVSTTNDRLHVRCLKAGRLRGGFRFEGEHMPTLERAIEETQIKARMHNVDSIALKTGDQLDVGARPGAVLLRIRLANGELSGAHVCIEGAALVALALAVSEFNKATAAPAAP
jgi:hypothetical protein